MSGARTVVDLVARGAARDPAATAVVAVDGSLTYAELAAEAGRLAHHLQALGVGPDVPVGVLLGRSTGLAVALVAVQQAGGACLPLDPAYPDERLRLMVDDAGAGAVVTTAARAGRVGGAVPVVRLDADRHQWADRPPGPPPRAAGPDHVGYVVFTSGSTGRPKGVLLTHRGLVHHHQVAADLYGLGPGDRVLQFCSLGFDASIEELFPTWAAGATVVFRPEDAPLLGRDWLAWLERERVSVLNLPTAYWHQWGRDLEAGGWRLPAAVRLVVVGGEKARGDAWRRWRRVGGGAARWVNAYGPTEATCMSTVHDVAPGAEPVSDPAGDPAIGRALPGTLVRVVGDDGREVAPGATGELLLGGPGLARGYAGDAALTAARFVDDPAGGDRPARLYRTGDVVRVLPGGELAFVGRLDDQVKVRGFRVECGEVEAALAAHPDVAEAAVGAVPDEAGGLRLVAWAAAPGPAPPAPGDLRRFVAGRLPDHMVPSAVLVVDALPRTPGGKVDRDGLPPPAPAATGAGGGGGGTPVERAVAGIWAGVLGLDPAAVGIHDDFFDLGGHSLLATQVIARVREELGTATPLLALFQAPTVAGLAAVVEAEGGSVAGAAPGLGPRTRVPGERLPLSQAQEQLLALAVGTGRPGLFNVTVLHRFDGPVDEAALRRALGLLVERHEALRTSFGGGGDHRWQEVHAAAEVPLDVVHAASEEDAAARLDEADGRPFDPARPPLMRATLLHLAGDDGRLAVTFDHLVCDGTGATVAMTELEAAYGELAAGRPAALAPLDVQFGDFAVWQRATVTDGVLDRQLSWWVAALAGAPTGPVLPLDDGPDVPSRRVTALERTVGPTTRRLLEERARATGGTVFTVAVAAVAALCGRLAGVDDVVFSTTLSGRTHAALEGVVGHFAGIGRIRVGLGGDPTAAEVAERARAFVVGMFDHQDVPFLRVRRAVAPEVPSDPVALAAWLPVELQYFHTSHQPWSSGTARRPRGDRHDQEMYFRGQLHPLSVTLLDDGSEIAVSVSYKQDFYRPATVARLADGIEPALAAVAGRPGARLSELPLG